MRNITVSVDDDVYHRARMWAAERRTSVSAMVRQMLREVAAEETHFEKLRREERELRERLRNRGVRFAASDRLSRDALHDRHAFR
jgi:Arc/MetJ-type ribon-helix-helix transcriptional regulator